jgi:hypothetical protein
MTTATPSPAPRRRAEVRATSPAELGNQLWKKVIEAAGLLPIHSGCEQELHGIIQRGADRMFAENRTAPEDLVLAEANIGRLINLMKHHAELLNHPQWLGEDTLHAANRALQAMRFELWPFWPW